MAGKKLYPKKANAPRGGFGPVQRAIFCIVCGLITGMVAWMADPQSLLVKKQDARDSYYNLLVQGFQAGQLNVKRDAPPGLARLADPYDPTANAAYVGNANDLSYYKGKLYLYFGVTPAVVLFWPYAVLTGHYLPERDASIIFLILGFSIMAGLSLAIWRRYFSETNVWMVLAAILAQGVALGLTIWCNVYEAAIACGFAFTMMALALIWRAVHEVSKPMRRLGWLALASLAYGLAVGARPSLLFGIVILLIPVIQTWREKNGPGLFRQVGLCLAAAAGPAMLIGLGLMLYNVRRFDNPFEFGWHYQLDGDYRATTARQFSFDYLWFNIRLYFLELVRWNWQFPFLKAASLPPLPEGYDKGVGDVGGGILMIYPAVWLLLAVPLALKNADGKAVPTLRWFVAAVFLLFLICSLTICLYLLAGERYELDFLSALLLLSVIGFLGIERRATHSPTWRRIAQGGWCLLLAVPVWVNLMRNIENRAEADNLVGNTFLAAKNADAAMVQFRAAMALWPDCADAHDGAGYALLQEGRVADAIVEYRKALEIKPDFAQARNNLATCLFQTGQRDEAIAQLQKTLALNPDYVDAYNNLGYCYLQIGRLEEAIAVYRKAVEIDPHSANLGCGLGNAFLEAGQTNEAIAQYQKVVETNPDFAGAYYLLGSCLLQAGRGDDAIVQFKRAVELKPQSPTYVTGLGDAFRQKKMAVEATACYRKALEIQPQFLPALIGITWMLATWPEASIRNGTEAVALAGIANQISMGNDPKVLRALAAAYAETGRFPEAVSTAQKAWALATAQSDKELTNELQTEIGLYQKNSPCRSTGD
jgi:tetratricopeptide (TPR) repeat protein